MTKTQSIGNGLKNLIANIPLALLALPASYGAARFSEKVYQEPVNWILGGAFESAYTGAIFFAQKKSRSIFMVTVASAVICGVIYNTLWAATTDTLLDNQFWAIRWLIALIHGAPLSVLAFAYAMLMHKTSDAETVVEIPVIQPQDNTLQDQKLEILNAQIQQDRTTLVSWLQEQFQTISERNEQSLQNAMAAISDRIDSVEVVAQQPQSFQGPENVRQFNILPQQQAQTSNTDVNVKQLVETGQLSVSDAVNLYGVNRATANSWLNRSRAKQQQTS
jgi:hypothetical protein